MPDIQNSESRTQHPDPASGITHPASSIQHPEPNFMEKLSLKHKILTSIQNPASRTQFYGKAKFKI
jgi:hypothetical protein